MNRREFITSAALAAPLMAQSANTAPSDRIRVAIIGMGGRGRDHMNFLARTPGVEVVAFCDPDRERLDEKASEWDKLGKPRPQLTQDLRRVLDDHSIDAVTIAACNHWHALGAIWACQAGKHVYVEKPVCHDAFEGSRMVAAARKYNRMVQGGTQRRSSTNMRAAVKALREGAIGDVYMARCIHFQQRDALPVRHAEPPPSTLDWNLWVGPGPMQPFNRNLVHYNWHWFWDFGNGELGNNGVHYIDVARWGLGKQLPVSISSSGGRYGYKDQGQTPNTQISTFRFDDGTELVAEIRGRYTNSEAGMKEGVIFYGSKGYMISDPAKDCQFRVYLGGNSEPEPVVDEAPGEDIQLAHFAHFFDAIRANNRDLLAADINETYLSTMFCLLGNISWRLGRSLAYDPAAHEFPSDQEANQMLKGAYRAPFKVPDQV
ncbi:MAG TPA: Gfo/Idh/MocA family oxidoreductase [Bryobacteraceae bacterium]|nr:Gfo/Idh/MocA family oxidoreductase [Bryobacteraceae bacterium]